MKVALGMSLALLVLILALPAFAGPFEDGKAAYDKGDYQAAVTLLMPLAEQGDAKAQWLIGYMYLAGSGLPQDTAATQAWWLKAAAQGNQNALCNLGQMFEFGWRGAAKDQTAAVGWYMKAARSGSSIAEERLSKAYEAGNGVSKDLVQAYAWQLLSVNGDRDGYGLKDLAQQMTPEQIAEGQRRASEWKPN